MQAVHDIVLGAWGLMVAVVKGNKVGRNGAKGVVVLVAGRVHIGHRGKGLAALALGLGILTEARAGEGTEVSPAHDGRNSIEGAVRALIGVRSGGGADGPQHGTCNGFIRQPGTFPGFETIDNQLDGRSQALGLAFVHEVEVGLVGEAAMSSCGCDVPQEGETEQVRATLQVPALGDIKGKCSEKVLGVYLQCLGKKEVIKADVRSPGVKKLILMVVSEVVCFLICEAFQLSHSCEAIQHR